MKSFVKIEVEELDRPAQSTELRPNKFIFAKDFMDRGITMLEQVWES